jgi:ribosomal protein S12 methylthiotransferase accessory factor
MINTPIFKPSFHVEVVDPEGVYLLSERGHLVLKGELHCKLAALLDGRRTADDLVDALADSATPGEVYYALGRLEDKGYVVEADGAFPAERAAFWHALGLDARAAERRLRETTVSLAGFGAVSLEPCAAALTALDVRVGDAGDFAVVLTDDYLQEGLADFNAAALASGRPWLLVKPVGTVLWIGPVFRPGQTACWECLAQRLRGNREVESYLHRRQHSAAPFPVSRAALPATVQTALHLAVTEAAQAIVRDDEARPGGTLTTLELTTLVTQQHVVVRRPQCPQCGDGTYGPDRAPVPVALRSQPKRYTADGGHRGVRPEETLARYGHHVSPITGAVSALARLPSGADESVHVYLAGHNAAMKADSLYFLRRGLRSKSSGKGMTDTQARASGIGEAIERYSGNFQGDEIRQTASYRRLGERAIHPNACLLYSEAQYQQRKEWNARGSSTQRVAEPFDEEAAVEWTPVWSLTEREFKYLLTSYCYYNYPLRPGAQYCWADSNGNAAGNTLEEAILQGFIELVERDGVALWWYNRLHRPAVDLESFDESYIRELQGQYARLNREVWALDLTTDLGIPTFAALSRRVDQPAEEIIFGFGAHFDPRISILRALTEMNQYLPLVMRSGLDGSGQPMCDDPDTRRWWQTATAANQPYLTPDASRPPRRCTDYPRLWSDDVREDVLHCQQLVERQGLDLLVLDQTRPDIGLPVVKVVVPGLRHFWSRYAPGRLYDVPVRLGWLDAPLAEEQLNPLPMFL